MIVSIGPARTAGIVSVTLLTAPPSAAACARLGLDVEISVAGGIRPETVKQALDTGAGIVVAGAAICGAPDPGAVAAHIGSLVQSAVAAA